MKSGFRFKLLKDEEYINQDRLVLQRVRPISNAIVLALNQFAKFETVREKSWKYSEEKNEKGK